MQVSSEEVNSEEGINSVPFLARYNCYFRNVNCKLNVSNGCILMGYSPELPRSTDVSIS